MHERTSREFTNGDATNKSITYLYDCNTIVGMVLNGATYFFQRNIQGDVVGVYDSTGTKAVGFRYDAFGRCTVIGDVNLAQWCKIRYRGYYYDTETGLYWVQTRYYNPDWCRWISPDSISYLDTETPHGLNLYLYCGNNPVNLYDPSGHVAIKLSSISSGFNFFGYELRTSAGWDTTPLIATSWFGRIGFSSYTTHTQGQSGILYAFAGSTSDVMNWFGTTYYAGLGINLFDIIGVEVQLETLGVGAQVSIGNFIVGANINLIGGTSITFGWNTHPEDDVTTTNGLTVGLNTGLLIAVIVWIYKAVTTGDTSPVPGLQPT